mgnify:CR=1 FL=1
MFLDLHFCGPALYIHKATLMLPFAYLLGLKTLFNIFTPVLSDNFGSPINCRQVTLGSLDHLGITCVNYHYMCSLCLAEIHPTAHKAAHNKLNINTSSLKIIKLCAAHTRLTATARAQNHDIENNFFNIINLLKVSKPRVSPGLVCFLLFLPKFYTYFTLLFYPLCQRRFRETFCKLSYGNLSYFIPVLVQNLQGQQRG